MTELPFDISVIIVNYNVKHFAEQCIRSVLAASKGLRLEIFLVDNHSSDESVSYLETKFPEINIIALGDNLGFARANNIALAQARGVHLLILNPDTLLAADTLKALSGYLDTHPEVGAVGPKILTRTGGFDVASKRGLPTPWVAFCKLSGLARLFPHSPLFGRYNLLYLDENQPAQVDALVGSCMMVRRAAFERVGGFDEDFFMYGEDIDWCYRIKRAGWQVHYAPVTSIIHFRGESTRRSTIDRDQAFYGAMLLFVNKHFRGRYPTLTHWLILLGIFLAKGTARAARLWRGVMWPLVDWVILAVVLVAARWLRWGAVDISLPSLFAMVIQVTVWTSCLAGFGAYGLRRGQALPVATAMLLGFLVNSSFTYFFQQFAFSRFLNLFGAVVGGGLVWSWRAALGGMRATPILRRFYQRRTLIVGAGPVAQALLEKMKGLEPKPYEPVGLIDPDEISIGSIKYELPVLGSEADLGRLVVQEEIEEVLFAYDTLDYNRILKVVGKLGNDNRLNFKVIPPDSALNIGELPPLMAVDYLTPRGMGGSLRKLSNLILGR